MRDEEIFGPLKVARRAGGGRPRYRFRGHPERSRAKRGAVEGPIFVDATTEQVPPLRLASLTFGRDDRRLKPYAIALRLTGEGEE